jgi:antitoxin (DNA-binding transcriptional repressor) of toxin-antitoxin stability system
VVDEDIDVFSAEAAAALLVERIEQGQPVAVRVAGDGRALLSPPFATRRDRVAGPGTAEGAASLRKFWVPARELLALRHDDPAGERYSGELNPAELSAALEAAQPPA